MYGAMQDCAKQAELATFLISLEEHKGDWYHNLLAVGLAAIDHAVSVCGSSNVTPMQHAHVRALNRFLE